MIFTLDTEEFNKAQSKNNLINKLAFAVMLKFFQIEKRYPTNKDLIDQNLVDSLIMQLSCHAINLNNYDWSSNNRTVKRFRNEIRTLLGYKQMTLTDSQILMTWLIDNILPEAPTSMQCQAHAYEFLAKNKIEACTPPQLERYINTAHYDFEKQFFTGIFKQLSIKTIESIDNVLKDNSEENVTKLADEPVTDANLEEDELIEDSTKVKLVHLKKGSAGVKLKNVKSEIAKLKRLRLVNLPANLLANVSKKLTIKYYNRIMAELPSGILDHKPNILYSTMAIFCYYRSQVLTDSAGDLLMRLTHKMRNSAETFINKNIVAEVKCVNGKFDILYVLADTAVKNPTEAIADAIYPKVSKETLENLAEELQNRGNKWYEHKVQSKIRTLYAYANRPMLMDLLEVFSFKTNNNSSKALLDAISFIKQNRHVSGKYYLDSNIVPITDVISDAWRVMVVEQQQESKVVGIEKKPTSEEEKENPKNQQDKSGNSRINRMAYEVAVLEELRRQLSCKLIWIEGAYRYRNPSEDLPKDFDERKEYYYNELGVPLDGKEFTKKLRDILNEHLRELNTSIITNPKVKIISKKNHKNSRIKITPYTHQKEPSHLKALQRFITRQWSTISLIDILKEADLRIGFSKHFQTVASKEVIGQEQLLKRLLLCLYAIGSNTGLKRISAANDDSNYSDLRYIKRRFINEANVRNSITSVVNAIFSVKDLKIWGEATIGCASDSTQLSCWDQNLMTEWHVRYHGRGVMIYWHVDKDATCIYSQLKTCLSSEVGAMLKGVLKHSTNMDMQKGYVDTHGQSTIGFGLSYLINFDLLPRLKNINKQKLYYAETKDKSNYGNLTSILQGSIDWQAIEDSYNEVIKHTTALKIGTVEPDVMIKHFSKDNYEHPVYKALTEIGKAVKTIFLCRYISSEELRIEINDALNVVERLNGIMDFIFYGKLGEISTNNREDQELAVVCLHLLQVCMVYINTLIIQEALSDPIWKSKLTAEDMRALTPLIHSHINPYGLFLLDLNTRLKIENTMTGLAA